ncbi:hypothetical protein D9M72_479720 [compost metagenome]
MFGCEICDDLGSLGCRFHMLDLGFQVPNSGVGFLNLLVRVLAHDVSCYGLEIEAEVVGDFLHSLDRVAGECFLDLDNLLKGFVNAFPTVLPRQFVVLANRFVTLSGFLILGVPVL